MDRAVLISEITQHAKSACRYCSGTGLATYILSNYQDTPVSNKLGSFKQQKICGCALKRFVKKHKDDVELDKDVLHWVKNTPALPEVAVPLGE